MSTKPEHLSLPDIKVDMNIDVIDHLRGHGLHGRVTRITDNNDGSTTIEFLDTRTGRYAWHATAMGLVPGTSSFWKTYQRSRSFDSHIAFGYVNSYGSRND